MRIRPKAILSGLALALLLLFFVARFLSTDSTNDLAVQRGFVAERHIACEVKSHSMNCPSQCEFDENKQAHCRCRDMYRAREEAWVFSHSWCF